MGFRFRRSVRVLPGVRLNFSKSGVSTSVGGHGTTVNFSKRGTRTIVGLPGTGLSYSSTKPRSGGLPSASGTSGGVGGLIALAFGLLLLVGFCSSRTTSSPSSATSIAATASTSTSYVTGNAVNCRASSDPRSAVLGRLTKGTSVAVSESANGWSHVTDSSAGDCWISSALLSQEAPASKPPSPQGFAALAATSAISPSAAGVIPGHRAGHGRRIHGSRSGSTSDGGCSCSGSHVCIGPRGGRYCITSGGNKRYGV